MTYQITISGIHCKGCISLITISLEDSGFSNINIDTAGKASFNTSEKEATKVEALLQKTFADLPGYTFSELKAL